MHHARDNETWLCHLRTSGVKQEEALADLRQLLIRGLSRSLQTRREVDAAFVEDIVQQTLLRILDTLDTFAGRSRFTTWAMSIAVHLAMSTLRRQHWQDISLESLSARAELPPEMLRDTAPIPEQHAEQHAVVDLLERLIDQELTDKQATAITAELQGMPLEEIARRMDSTPNALYKLLHDARKRLKHGLETAGYDAEDIQAVFP